MDTFSSALMVMVMVMVRFKQICKFLFRPVQQMFCWHVLPMWRIHNSEDGKYRQVRCIKCHKLCRHWYAAMMISTFWPHRWIMSDQSELPKFNYWEVWIEKLVYVLLGVSVLGLMAVYLLFCWMVGHIPG